MSLTDYFTESFIKLDENQAELLSHPPVGHNVIEVKLPESGELPTTLNRVVRNIMEIQSKWFGLINASPTTAFEIRRPRPDKVRFQFAVPTKRLERKLRTHLIEEIPGIELEPGTSGLPVAEEVTIGGGLLTVGRTDYHPLRRDFDHPPANSVAVALHRHAMQDTRFVIQVLFQPLAGHPIRRWWWTRKAYKQVGYLRKEKHATVPWHDRPATPQEKKQADQIEEKARNPRFRVAIRILVIDAGEHTKSRVKEVAGGFNVFEDPVSNQYLDIHTITPVFAHRIIDFAETVRSRELDEWALPFQASIPEVAGLVSLPDRNQDNLSTAKP